MSTVDELWLGVLQQICARSAHEVRGALNGVSVNLEVVRTRALKPDAQASTVGPFAATASDQLELVVEMTEALLALGRAAREPVEVIATTRRIATLLAPSARAEGGSLRLEEPPLGAAGYGVRAPASVVRLVIGAALLAATQNKGHARCRLHAADEVVVSVERVEDESESFRIAPEIVAAAADVGVRVQVTEQGISLAFPRAHPARQRTHETA